MSALESNPYLSNPEYSSYIHLSRYARYLWDEGRRETWEETVERTISYWRKKFPKQITKKVADELRTYILEMRTMPSMRALMTAGKALDLDNVAGFNCSFLLMNRKAAFDELMYVLLCGTGVGFSAEEEFTNQLPRIAEEMYDSDTTIVVPDSKIGWASSFRELISLLYSGKVPKWDMSKIRPAGAPLKTFGGRASGPEPLIELFQFTVNTFNRFKGERLPSIAVHDLVCKIAEIVVVGGVRRSALISLSDLNDSYMSTAKSNYKVKEYTLLDRLEDGKRKYSVIVDDAPYGERSLIVKLDDWESGNLQSAHELHWMHVHPERSLANNSVAYTEIPEAIVFGQEWLNLIKSYSGERGLFSRPASQTSAARSGRRDATYPHYGTNPCSEIILRDRQFCNLSEVVVRHDDTFESLSDKVRVATILGTLQATLTDFRYLSKKWKENTEEEALLGVSLTGIMDHPVLNGTQEGEQGVPSAKQILPEWLEKLREVAVETNLEWSAKLGINPSAAITCVKPSGTVSQLVDSASGIHPRYAPYYIRTVRADKKDPLYHLMKDANFPVEDAFGKEDSTAVFSFPMTAPSHAVYRDDRTAIEQLETWLTYQRHWCEHKPSVTIYVKDHEWFDVQAWVFKHFDEMSGVSFLPHDGGTYKQAPYQECTKEEYEELLAKMPVGTDWTKLGEYESTDMTTGSQELACVGGACEIR